MTTKAQKALGISSNMSDKKLRRLLGMPLEDIPNIKPIKGPSQSINSWLQSKKKKKKKSKKA